MSRRPGDRRPRREDRYPTDRHLPTEADINVHDTIDEKWAVKEYLGKTIEEIETRLCTSHAIDVTEELSGIGLKAFCFYITALVRYLKSDSSIGDSGVIDGFCGMVEWRLRNAREIKKCWPTLLDATDFVIEHIEKYDLIPIVYGHLPARLAAIQQRLRSLLNLSG